MSGEYCLNYAPKVKNFNKYQKKYFQFAEPRQLMNSASRKKKKKEKKKSLALLDLNDRLCVGFRNEKLEAFRSDASTKVLSVSRVVRSVSSGQTAGREAVKPAGLKLKLNAFKHFPKTSASDLLIEISPELSTLFL